MQFPLLLLALLLCGPAQAEVAIPQLHQRVTDLTGTLDGAQTQALERKLADIEARKGAQVALLLVPSTQPETIEQFGIRVADNWKLGRKGVDDGVLLLVAKDDRRLRIEVGYGLEGALNDATAKRIIAEIITPFFKHGDFYGGLDAGIAAIAAIIEGEQLPLPAAEPAQASTNTMSPMQTFFALGVLGFVLGNLLLRQFVGRFFSGLLVAGGIGMLAWVMLASIFWTALATALAFILSLMFGLGGRGSVPVYPGWGGGGGSTGWGSSDHDFGGGGGGFGGGGASGDW